MVKLIVWAGIVFGLYTGWCYLPAWQEPRHMAATVENFLEHGKHTTHDALIREKTWKAAGSRSIDLAQEDIEVSRERASGQRIVQVRFRIPVTVEWLGRKQTLLRQVDVRHSYAVDEAAERARLDRIAENERIDRHNQRIAEGQSSAYERRMRAECAKGNRHVTVTHVMVTNADGQVDTVPCDAVRRW